MSLKLAYSWMKHWARNYRIYWLEMLLKSNQSTYHKRKWSALFFSDQSIRFYGRTDNLITQELFFVHSALSPLNLLGPQSNASFTFIFFLIEFPDTTIFIFFEDYWSFRLIPGLTLSLTTVKFFSSFPPLYSSMPLRKTLLGSDYKFLSQHTQQLALQHVIRWQQHNGRLCPKQKQRVAPLNLGRGGEVTAEGQEGLKVKLIEDNS